jgi:hypothetical protein
LYLAADVVRPLGLASSAAESAGLAAVSVGLGCTYLKFEVGLLRTASILVLIVGTWALVISGTRTFLLLSIAAAAVVLVGRTKRPVTNLVLALAFAIPIISAVSSRLLASATLGANRTLTTLSGQEDLSTSTIPLHVELAMNGILHGITTGIGTGSGQLGVLAELSGNAETDLANAATMAGLVGLIAILLTYIFMLKHVRGTIVTGGVRLEALVVLAATFGQWLNVGFYGLTCFIWLALGAYAIDARRGNRIGELDGNRERRPSASTGRTEPIRTGLR